jgi:tetratricopeptide (TPR) repeat protein
MPQNFQVRIKVAELFKKKGMLDEALDLYMVASSAQPNNAEVQANLGNIYLQKNDLVNALKGYKQSVKINSESAENQYQLGRLLRLEKQFKKSRQALEKALSLNGDHIPTYYELGLVLLAESEGVKAEDLLSEAVRREPNNVVYSRALANAQMVNKKYDVALDGLLKLIKINPNIPDLLFDVCKNYSKKRFLTAAIDFCERSLKLKPKELEVMNRLAWLYAKKRIKLDKGLELIQRAIKLYPGNSKYADTYAELLFSKGDTEGAINIMSENIRVDPSNRYYKKQLFKFKSSMNSLNKVQN